MKGVVLAGGLGTRLLPMTKVTNKHLLPVFDRPMIYFPIQQLVHAGIDDILIVTGGNHAGDFLRLLGNGKEFGLRRLHYAYQEGEGGIAEALGLAEDFSDGGPICVILGDNIFETPIREAVDAYRADPEGAMVLLKEVDHPERFGVAELREGRIVSIVEKPAEPISKLANIGLYYMRDRRLLFEGIAHTLASEPGPSGEFYLTDAFQYMVDQGAKIQVAPVDGWYDCGKPETLLDTNRYLLERGRAGVDDSATVEGSNLIEPVRVEDGALVMGCTLGPNVTVESRARIEGSTLVDTMVGSDAVIEWSDLRGSLVGSHSQVRAFRGQLSVVDHSEIVGGQ